MGVFLLKIEGVFPFFFESKENTVIRDFCVVAVKYLL